MPSVRTSTSVTTTAPYTLPGPRVPEEDLRVDDPPLFRAEESPREPSVAPPDSSEDNSSEFRRDFNASVYECVRSIPEGKASRLGSCLPFRNPRVPFCRMFGSRIDSACFSLSLGNTFRLPQVASYGQIARLIGHPRHSRMCVALSSVCFLSCADPGTQ